MLTNLPAIGSLSAKRLVRQAQAQANGQVLRIGKGKLPKSRGELGSGLNPLNWA